MSAEKVLVVDDSDVARQSICDVLRTAGYEVHEMNSPIGATRELLRRDIGIVVLDVEMPALRGDRLAGLIRSNLADKVTLLLVSSLPEDELRSLAEQVGADAHVGKANVQSELVPTLRRIRGGTSP